MDLPRTTPAQHQKRAVVVRGRRVGGAAKTNGDADPEIGKYNCGLVISGISEFQDSANRERLGGQARVDERTRDLSQVTRSDAELVNPGTKTFLNPSRNV
jgi:hypothetical protein